MSDTRLQNDPNQSIEMTTHLRHPCTQDKQPKNSTKELPLFSSLSLSNSEQRIHSFELESQNEQLNHISSITDRISMDAETLQLLSQPLPMRSNIMSFFVGAFVAVGGFLFGYDTGLINSLIDMEYVKTHLAPNHEYFTTIQMSMIVSFLSMGTFFGALSAPFIADSYGRKKTIIFSTAFIFSIGKNSLQVAASDWKLLLGGRIVSGIGVGLISAVVPSYQAESAQKNLRGAIISTYQWAITIGLLVSSAVSQGTLNMRNSGSYRIPIGLQYVWSCFLAIGMLFLPESPRYYVMKDELDKAAKSLSFLRGITIQDPRLLEELVEIKATYDYEASFGPSTFWDCFKTSPNRPKQSLRMFTGIAIQTFQQFSGINFIFYYGVNFFNNTGVAESYLVSITTYAVNVVFNIPGMFLVEMVGRRKILLFGGLIVTISNFIIASVGCSTDSIIANKVMIAFICVFIAAFSASWGGVVWVISAELYPLGVRSKCTAICAATNWLINFICAFITPFLVDTGSHTSTMGAKIFFIWGGLNALGVIVVYFTVYETGGLTLEEIDELYTKSPNSFESAKWNKIIRERPLGNPINRVTSLKINNKVINKDDENITKKINITSNEVEIPNLDGVIQDPLTQEHDFSFINRIPIEPLSSHDNFVDLGNGLGLNTYKRGPPSFLTDSSDDESGEGGSFSVHYSGDIKDLNNVNTYIAQLVDSNSNASTNTNHSISTHKFSHSIGTFSSTTQGTSNYSNPINCNSDNNTNNLNTSMNDIDGGFSRAPPNETLRRYSSSLTSSENVK
ncbi:glucose sensor NDAI_0A02150 [Naumovozyma dairenensis CBS 421]|uniref:Major facilitator superfamily (MFS) profile domain-containing protein n=1 Tax=Naumovozyma dairenensis (strain ATCC 10597 / BCRC 20456 / CBS 421 / NBRC 0211 / NRRL Y-12639) TaxID=1071378 RepID=G0W3I5_NAUDC|nr:hypothetical protein NDAI_0A02150 [Naumovozyma dairenensis CBS 421]CCD22373.1 hypothetical protein NDAI_0A02150 [Naumovozyma dairenensis CBS 421]